MLGSSLNPILLVFYYHPSLLDRNRHLLLSQAVDAAGKAVNMLTSHKSFARDFKKKSFQNEITKAELYDQSRKTITTLTAVENVRLLFHVLRLRNINEPSIDDPVH